MNLNRNTLSKDLKANKGNVRSLIFVLAFRASHYFSKNVIRRIIGLPVRIMYRILSEFIYRLEIKDFTEIGGGLVLWHGGHATVINPYTRIGCNVKIRQNITIGSSSFTQDQDYCPTIGDGVEIGPNSVIIGNIQIGDYSIIAAGAVVVKDVPAYAVVAGNPARVIKIQDPLLVKNID